MPTESISSTDQHGLAMTAPSDGIALYDATLSHLLPYDAGLLDLLGRLNEEHPDMAMTHVMTGYLTLTSTDQPDVAGAAEAVTQLRAISMNEREAAHERALAAWVGGDWHGASARLDDLLQRWPADLLALLVGHQLDFFLGDAANLRDRPARSLMSIDSEHPHAGFARGMMSFGLEESGSYEAAEDLGRQALAVNPRDVWAVHAVTHANEMRGRVDDGIRFLRGRADDWAAGNLFTVHNWWHLALFHLEAGQHDEVLAIYDREIHHAESMGVPLEMLDASALLWRLMLDGVDTGGRFETLADAWAARSAAEPWYAFNDLHAVLALVGAGRIADAAAVVERLQAYVDANSATSNAMMTATVGLPACRAIVAYGTGQYAQAVRELAPIRRISSRFGGSHAQRDVLQRTLLDAAIADGQHDVARVLVSERLTTRDTSVYGWTRQARLMRAMGRIDDADVAEQRARSNRERFAAAG